MTALRTHLPLADCSGCPDAAQAPRACGGCEPFTVEGSPAAVADCLVRLADQGWRIRTETVQVAPRRWRTHVATPQPRPAG